MNPVDWFAENRERLWNALLLGMFLFVSIGFTFWALPREIRLLRDSEIAQGLISSEVERSCPPESGCSWHADVLFATGDGQDVVVRLEVGDGARTGDQIDVRYVRGKPSDAVAQRTHNPTLNLVIFTIGGPVALLGVIGFGIWYLVVRRR